MALPIVEAKTDCEIKGISGQFRSLIIVISSFENILEYGCFLLVSDAINKR